MWEIDIRNKETDEIRLIYGYNIEDAFERYNLKSEEWIITNTTYVD